MKQVILSAIGDGQDNASMMRVIVFLIILAVIASKFYNAWITKTAIEWDAHDLELAGMAIGGKLVQNTQENAVSGSPGQPEKASTETPVKN